MSSTYGICEPGSSVGIATDYGLDGPGIESRWGARFSADQTGTGAHPASCTMGTRSFPGINYGRGVLLNTQVLLAPWPWKSRAIPLPTLRATIGPVTGTLYLLPLWRMVFRKKYRTQGKGKFRAVLNYREKCVRGAWIISYNIVIILQYSNNNK